MPAAVVTWKRNNKPIQANCAAKSPAASARPSALIQCAGEEFCDCSHLLLSPVWRLCYVPNGAQRSQINRLEHKKRYHRVSEGQERRRANEVEGMRWPGFARSLWRPASGGGSGALHRCRAYGAALSATCRATKAIKSSALCGPPDWAIDERALASRGTRKRKSEGGGAGGPAAAMLANAVAAAVLLLLLLSPDDSRPGERREHASGSDCGRSLARHRCNSAGQWRHLGGNAQEQRLRRRACCNNQCTRKPRAGVSGGARRSAAV